MKLGILAGGGPFPVRIAQAAVAAGHDVLIICIRDFCDPSDFASFVIYEERLGAGGAIVRRLKEEGISHLVLAGRARRPSLLSLWPDPWMANALRKIGGAAFSGDDTLLKATLRLLAEEGFEVLAPETFLGESLAGKGLLVGAEPDETARRDIARGIMILRSLGSMDVGQAVIVQQGLVLGIEAVEGTDALIERAGALARQGAGGILVKLAKPGQELRVDAPVIGPITIVGAARAGLRGIAVEAGRTLLADKSQLLLDAMRNDLFIIGVDPEGIAADMI